jgi:glycosyltransferase involved in cell wall biosynthesis
VYDGLRRAGVAGRAVMIGATREMPALYAAGDVVVLPTYYDPASKVVIEGLMMGRPGITTSYNGAADLVVPGGGRASRGVVIDDPGDAEALAEAMATMLDAERRRAFVEAIGPRLAAELSMARHVDRLLGVLGEVADAERGGGQSR